MIGAWGREADPRSGKSISISIALRACERAKLRERERESPSVARARQRNLSVRRPSSVRAAISMKSSSSESFDR